MESRFLGAIAAAAVLWSSPARALNTPTVYDNYQMVPIGGRAAGMGGAYTALACDEGALHYNPASLSCAASSHLELSANAYVLQGVLARGALGSGRDISAVSYHSIPSIVGAVRILREGSERSPVATYPGRLTFGFTVSVPSTVALKISSPRPDVPDAAAFSVRDDLTAGDVGLGYQLNQALSLGLSFGAVLRTVEQRAAWLLVRSQRSCAPANCNDYLAYDDDRQALAVGGRAKLGVLYRPMRRLTFGLTVTTPTVHLYGKSEEVATITRGDGPEHTVTPLRALGSSEVSLPLRVALGFGVVRKRYTFSLDLSLNFPHEVRVAHGMVSQPVAGLNSAIPVPDTVIHAGPQPNFNLGAAVPFGPEKELNIGFFSDFSSVSSQDVMAMGLDRVHMFGGSMTLGLLGKQSRLWVGMSGEIGHTTTKVPGRAFNYEGVVPLAVGALPADRDATLTRWTMTGILGSNYSFLE
jgi:long-chain fatty acid transport protein